MTNLILTETQRGILKKPLGELIIGAEPETRRRLSEVIAKEKPPVLIFVGDAVARNAVRAGIKPDVVIIDHIEKRGKTAEFVYEAKKVLSTANPAGTITQEAWRTVEKAVKQRNVLVNVDGEEDLLALVAILASPLGAFVVYGQPDEGIVLVRVSDSKKHEVEEVVAQMISV